MSGSHRCQPCACFHKGSGRKRYSRNTVAEGLELKEKKEVKRPRSILGTKNKYPRIQLQNPGVGKLTGGDLGRTKQGGNVSTSEGRPLFKTQWGRAIHEISMGGLRKQDLGRRGRVRISLEIPIALWSDMLDARDGTRARSGPGGGRREKRNSS